MATLGIDIGGSTSVMAAVGRGTVDIVRNDISERLTPSLVGFTDHERLLGDPALTLFKSNFRNTCRNMKMVLGRVYDASIAEEQCFSYPALVPAEEGLVGYQVKRHGEDAVFSATSVMAAMLTGLRDTAERSLKQPVVEAVIAVPSWYSDRHCQAMLDAAKIAGIPCLRVMSEHAATALDYGIYRAAQFHPKEAHRVMFVNVGYSTASVCITDFVQNELRIVHVASDPHLGGRDMDKVLSEHMAMDISKRMGVDVLQNPKARMKIEEAVGKAKKILSANQEASISLESLIGDEDLNATISREDFTEKCGHLKERLALLLRNAFQKNGGAHVHSIELVGGSTRIPWVQECILEVAQEAVGSAGGDESQICLSRTVNQDECVAKGCALQAAMLSPRFKVRDFNIVDIIVHPVAVSWPSNSVPREMQAEGSVGDADMGSNGDKSTSEWNSQLLVSRDSPYPAKKWISFEPSETFAFKLSYAEPDTLPPTVDELLGHYRVQLPYIPKTPDAKLKLKLNVDINRKCCVEACLSEKEQVEVIVKEKRPVTPTATDDTASTTTSQQTAGSPASKQDGQPTTPQSAEATASKGSEKDDYVEVKKMKTQTKRTAVKVIVAERRGWLTDAVIQDLREKEVSMINDDRMHCERKEKLNDLESYVYTMRDKIDNGELRDYFEPSVKVSFLEALNNVAEWIYDEGEAAQKSTLVAKLDELKAVGDRAAALKLDRENREEAMAGCLDQCREMRMAASSPDERFSHIDMKQKSDIIDRANQLEAWLNEQVALQSSQPLYADPVLTAAQIVSQTKEFTTKATEILSTPKPAPPAPEPTTPPPTATEQPAAAGPTPETATA